MSMIPSPRQRFFWTGVTAPLAAAFIAGGCNTDAIIRDSLAAENPAAVDAPVGVPPVPMEALSITPTGMPPTHTSAVQPDPILPKMDEAYKQRRFPPGTGPQTPATQPADHEGPPEGQFQPELPPR